MHTPKCRTLATACITENYEVKHDEKVYIYKGHSADIGDLRPEVTTVYTQ